MKRNLAGTARVVWQRRSGGHSSYMVRELAQVHENKSKECTLEGAAGVVRQRRRGAGGHRGG